MPAPFGPMMLVTLPLSTRAETSDTARSPPNEMPMSLTSSGWFAVPAATRSFAETGAGAASSGSARRNRFASAPAMPLGANSSTVRSRTPNSSTRYSASPASASGNPTTIAAPITGP